MSASVLLIDDHDGFRVKARRVVEGAGHRVVAEAADGSSGLRAARGLRPDLVLLDVGLPDISGLEVARELHRELPELAVVLISTHSGGDFARLARDHGARGFLAKEDLSGEALERFLGGAG